MRNLIRKAWAWLFADAWDRKPIPAPSAFLDESPLAEVERELRAQSLKPHADRDHDLIDGLLAMRTDLLGGPSAGEVLRAPERRPLAPAIPGRNNGGRRSARWSR